MNTLEQLGTDLQGFFASEEPIITSLPSVERSLNEEIAVYSDNQSQESIIPRCARIAYDGVCGFAQSGSTAYVVNARNEREVRATVRVFWRQGIDHGQSDRVFTIPAGSRILLGCTRGNFIPVAEYSFQVVGCQIL